MVQSKAVLHYFDVEILTAVDLANDNLPSAELNMKYLDKHKDLLVPKD